jgi:acetyl esterase/lipase
MTVPSIERKTRASLPILRFMQTYLPLPLAQFLLKQSMARVRLGADLSREAISADGVPCEWIIPKDNLANRVLLYLHGGGFVYGLTPQHFQMGARLARIMGVRVLMADYHLAPDYPFPVALDDCITAYRWLLKQDI